MVVDHETWPSEGRLGFCTSGEYAGCYALVTAEYEDRWIIYVSSMPDASGAVCRADDFSTIDELIESVISDMGIEWVPADIESKLEEEVFELRKHWRQLAKNSQRSWPGVKSPVRVDLDGRMRDCPRLAAPDQSGDDGRIGLDRS